MGDSNLQKDIELYLQKKKWQVKAEANQWNIRVCPLCGDSGSHFYINKSSGQFQCWKCKEKGNLYTLKKKLGDLTKKLTSISDAFGNNKKKKVVKGSKVRKYHKALLGNATVRKFLKKEWNITKTEINLWKLGYVKKKDGIKWLTIPHYMDGDAYNIKYRSLPPAPKRFQREAGRLSVLYNSDVLKECDEVILVEGERDVWTLVQQGIENVVGTTSGAGALDPAWLDQLEGVSRVYIVSDNDIAGQREVVAMAEKIGIEKCKNVIIPANDVSEYFHKMGGTKAKFKEFLKKGKYLETQNLISIANTFRQMEENLLLENELESRIKTPFERLNEALGGGFSLGDLVVLSARPKIGKTTFALNVVLDVVLHLCPSLVYCLEMKPEKLLMKAISCYRGVEMRDIHDYDVVMTRARYFNKPLYFGHSFSGINLESVESTIRYAVRRHGVQLVVFDNLSFLARNSSDVTRETGRVTKTFKLLAEELNVCFVLIAHPKKIEGERVMTSDDLKDSSSIHQDADVVAVMHRKKLKDGKLSELVRFIIDAGRYTEVGTEVNFNFDGANSKFVEIEVEKEEHNSKKKPKKKKRRPVEDDEDED